MTPSRVRVFGGCSDRGRAACPPAGTAILSMLGLMLGFLPMLAPMEATAAADGQILWRYKPSREIRAPMAVSSNGVVYLALYDGIVALNGQTGAKLWQSDPLRPDYYAGPVVGRSGNIFVIIKGANDLVALSGVDGSVLWQADVEAPTSQASLALAPGGLLVAGTSTTVRAYDELTGELRWAFGDSDRKFGPISTGPEGQVIFGDAVGAVTALSSHTGEPLWLIPGSGNEGAAQQRASFGIDGNALVVTDFAMRSIDPRNGFLRWIIDHSGLRGQVLVGEDGLLFDGATGPVVDPRTGASHAYELPLGETTLTSSPRALLAGGAGLFFQNQTIYSVHLASHAVQWKTNLGAELIPDDFKVGPSGIVYVSGPNSCVAIQGSSPLARTPWPVSGGDSGNAQYVPFALEAPWVYGQPADAAVVIGKSLALRVEGLGREPISYQWYRNGSKLDSDTNSVLQLESIAAADNGARFQVVLQNDSGSATSRVAVVSSGYAVESWTQGPGNVIKTPDLPVYPPNTVVTLQAIPEAGQTFSHWNSDLGLNSPSLPVTVVANTSMTAVFNAKPGDRWWTFRADSDLVGCPAVGDDGTIYVTSIFWRYNVTESAWKLSAVDPATGKEKWQITRRVRRDLIGGDFYGVGTPALGLDGTIYLGIGRSVLALDPTDGQARWERTLTSSVTSALALDDEGGIFAITDRVIGLNAADGSPRWQFTLPPRPSGQPWGGLTISYSGKLLVGEYLVHALDRFTGHQIWEFSFASYNRALGYHTYPTPALDGSVLIGSGYGGSFGPYPRGNVFFALDQSDGKFLWREFVQGAFSSIPSIGPDGSVYEGGSYGDVHAFEPVTRQPRWTATTMEPPTDGEFTKGPVTLAADSTAYYSLSTGQLYAMDTVTGGKKWSFDAHQPYLSTYRSSLPLALGLTGQVYFASHSNLYSIVGTAPLATSGFPKFMGNARNSGSGLVDPPQPKITRQPTSQLAAVGSPVHFQVVGQGAWPLTHQWYRDGVILPGATSSELTLPSVGLSDGGAKFQLVLSNAFGRVVSEEAKLEVGFSLTRTVQGQGQIQVVPDAQVFAPGSEVQLTAVPNGERKFEFWLGDLEGTAMTQSIRILSNTLAVARFNLEPRDPLWTLDVGTKVYFPPAIDDDETVVVAGATILSDNEGSEFYRIVGLDGRAGKVLWKRDLPAPISAVPVIGENGSCYIVSNLGQNLRSLKTRTGQPSWEAPFGPDKRIVLPPAVGPDGSVYLSLANGSCRCLDGANGKLRWESNAGGAVSSLLIGGENRLYLHSGVLTVRNLGSGAILAAYPNVYGAASLIMDSSEVIYGLESAGYLGVQGLTGLQVLTAPAASEDYSGTPLAVGLDGTLYFSTFKSIWALDPTTGSRRWSSPFQGWVDSSSPPAVLTSDGIIYVSQYKLYAFDASSGGVRWDFAELGGILSPPAVGKSGNVYLGSSSGKCHILRGTQAPAPSGWSQYLGNSKRQSRITPMDGPYLATSPGPTRDTIVLNWQEGLTAFALESTTSPSFPEGWLPVRGAPQKLNGRLQLVVPRPSVPTFFRLRKVE